MNKATPTLLYIDDDEALARLVDRGLTRRWLQGCPCASGRKARELIRRG
jgi:ActR/RegA family two-component response regulator